MRSLGRVVEIVISYTVHKMSSATTLSINATDSILVL